MDVELTDLAWAAGFLDGEGCIQLAKPSNKVHASTRSVLVHCTQLKREPLDKLAAMFGGNVRPMRLNKQGYQIWQWNVTRAELVINCLEGVLPYLTSKRAEAEVVLAYAKTVKRRGKVPLSPMLIVRRNYLIRQHEQARKVV